MSPGRKQVARLMLFALASLSSSILAQTVGGGSGGGGVPYAGITKYHTFGNAQFGVLFTANTADQTGSNSDKTDITAEGQNLSGTNVEFTLVILVMKLGNIPPPPVCTASTISNIKVYLLNGGSPDDTLPQQVSDVDIPCNTSRKYRLATTYLSHGSDIHIRVTATFTFEHPLYEGRTETQIAYDETFTFKAYNELLPLATNLNGLGQIDPEIQAVGDGVTNAAKNALIPGHLVNPDAGLPARLLDRDALIDLLRNSTSMAALTHGFDESGGGFEDSFGSGIFWNTQISLDVADRVAEKAAAGIPGYTVVAFWSCATLKGGDNAPGAFEIDADDEGYAGFEDIVLKDCWFTSSWEANNWNPPNQPYDTTLDAHAATFYFGLGSGLTLDESLALANDSVMPMSFDQVIGYAPLPMVPRGDLYARLQYVYLDLADRMFVPDVNIWYYKVPPAP